MAFSDQLWNRIAPIYDAILEHPFINELAGGTLPEETFLFYISQDTLYLADYSRALALAGVHAEDSGPMHQFLNFAVEVVGEERELHEQLYERFEADADIAKSPGCLSYTSFLLATAAIKDQAVAAAALLPCFWIYREVGMHIFEHSAPSNPYQDWIDTYAGEAFNEGVEEAIAITNRTANAESAKKRQQMQQAFVRSSQLEWMFWDSAYRREEWPQKPTDSVPA